ncbi:heterokaryon incompatibility protein-domain-containing protein [Halenospora varia]|nr:heterokaryon incompatibility protein-domain-containing protein [Halenospora varia]
MGETLLGTTEPCTGPVVGTPDQICDGCGKLTLSALLKSPSISLRKKHYGLDEMERFKALVSNPPIALDISRIKSNQSQCSVCNLIQRQLTNEPVPAGSLMAVYKCEDLDDRIESLWLYFPGSKKPIVQLTIFADEGTFASRHIPYRPVADSGSDKSIQDIKDWITTCNRSHTRCRYSLSGAKIKHSAPLPTRVIDVGGSPETVRLMESSQKAAQYVALSHCWGGSSHYRTTESSLEQHKNALKIIDLPKTLQNAVFVVRKLGLRYLWVDSLCIIQDDEDDWLREASRMADVYEGAYLTIAASASSDGSGGLFLSREVQELVRLPCEKTDEVSGHMYFGIADMEAAQRMLRGPLNSRAWVLQEHLFARRTLHFGADQMYWECDKFLMGQDRSDSRSSLELKIPTRALLVCILGDFLGPDRMPHLVENPSQERFNGADYYTWWCNAIRYFSKCGLTKSSDKLPALLSLSTELGKLTSDDYHEGHWHWHAGTLLFISSLLWHSSDKNYLSKGPQFRAPSWSWAALDGSLDFADMYCYNLADIFHPEDTDLQILKVQHYQPVGLPSRKALLLQQC